MMKWDGKSTFIVDNRFFSIMIYQKLYKIKQYIVSLGQKNVYKFRFRKHGRADAPTRFSFNNTFIMAGVMFYFFVPLVQNEKMKKSTH